VQYLLGKGCVDEDGTAYITANDEIRLLLRPTRASSLGTTTKRPSVTKRPSLVPAMKRPSLVVNIQVAEEEKGMTGSPRSPEVPPLPSFEESSFVIRGAVEDALPQYHIPASTGGDATSPRQGMSDAEIKKEKRKTARKSVKFVIVEKPPPPVVKEEVALVTKKKRSIKNNPIVKLVLTLLTSFPSFRTSKN
jgi:hypothetical protein